MSFGFLSTEHTSTEEPKTPGTGRFAFGSQAINYVINGSVSTSFRRNQAISCSDILQVANMKRRDLVNEPRNG